MKTRFSTVDLRAVLAELNARYRTSGDQACAGGAGGRGHGPTVEIRRALCFPSPPSPGCCSPIDLARPEWASA